MTALHSFVSPLGRAGALLPAGLAIFFLIAAAGCSAASPTATAVPPAPVVQPETQPETQPAAPSASEPAPRTAVSAAEVSPESTDVPERGPAFPAAEEGDIEPIQATTVLNPGTQRVAFLLVGPKAIVKAPGPPSPRPMWVTRVMPPVDPMVPHR